MFLVTGQAMCYLVTFITFVLILAPMLFLPVFCETAPLRERPFANCANRFPLLVLPQLELFNFKKWTIPLNYHLYQMGQASEFHIWEFSFWAFHLWQLQASDWQASECHIVVFGVCQSFCLWAWPLVWVTGPLKAKTYNEFCACTVTNAIIKLGTIQMSMQFTN